MSDGGNGYLRGDGTFTSSSDWKITKYIPCDGNAFVINPIGGNTPAICLYDSDKNYITGKAYNTGGTAIKQAVVISTETTAHFIRFTYKVGTGMDNLSTIMLNSGSTPLPYEPYGYKIPIICGGITTLIYIGDEPLRKSLDGTAVDELSSNGILTQRVDTDGSILPTPIISQINTPEIPTTNGSNTLTVDTTLQPSEVSIVYKK